jgi:aspartyl-tRNA synthetase
MENKQNIMSKRILAKETSALVGQDAMLMGWANSRRDHGGVIFIDLRDESGLVQVTVHPDVAEAFAAAEGVRDEYVLKVSGRVIERDPELINPNLETGKVEVVVSNLEILNKSEPLPFSIKNEDENVGEDVRLKYRYLDLRRPKMGYMLKRRAQMYSYIRNYMEEKDFTEVATPILANSSPEGARDFLIPSRFKSGTFYALPQAPQQFKQLLMVGGIPRYYQFATCFRDEDTRADRLYGDFYQLDMEMAFVEDGEEVRKMLDPLITGLVTDFAGKTLKLKEFPRITYQEAMNKYGSDKPDLRFGMELVDLSSDLQNTEFGVFGGALKNGGVVKAICVKGGASLTRSEIDKFTEVAKLNGAGGLVYINLKDDEVQSPIAKFLKEDELSLIVEKTGAKDGDAIFFGADSIGVVNRVLGVLRSEFADRFGLKDPNVVAALWVVDFPFYEWDDKTNKLDFGHNPFSMPKGGLEALEGAETDEERLAIVADQYDLVINGYECSSGAVRNYSPEIMYKAFDILGYSSDYVDAKFGGMLSAFKYGAPPHAGCAPGLDRIFMILMGEDNIREIVAFPKNGSGIDLMMNSPSVVEDAQLKELGIKLR